jgi:hypothetical protein
VHEPEVSGSTGTHPPTWKVDPMGTTPFGTTTSDGDGG